MDLMSTEEKPYQRTCESCGKGFSTDKEWARSCYPCWKAQKDKKARQETLEEILEVLLRIEVSLSALPKKPPQDTPF